MSQRNSCRRISSILHPLQLYRKMASKYARTRWFQHLEYRASLEDSCSTLRCQFISHDHFLFKHDYLANFLCSVGPPPITTHAGRSWLSPYGGRWRENREQKDRAMCCPAIRWLVGSQGRKSIHIPYEMGRRGATNWVSQPQDRLGKS
jgi:hypothetical protein